MLLTSGDDTSHPSTLDLAVHAKLVGVELILHIPNDVAQKLAAIGGDVSRRALEALALEGYRQHALTLYQISEMLGLSRIETEDFLGNIMWPSPRSANPISIARQPSLKQPLAAAGASRFTA